MLRQIYTQPLRAHARAVSRLGQFQGVRFASTLTKYIDSLKSPSLNEESLPEILQAALSDGTLQNNDKIKLSNVILENCLKHDASLSLIHQRQLEELKGDITDDAVYQIIKYNSGRVHSAWELFEKYLSSLKDEKAVTKLVAEKLIHGEIIDLNDDEFKVSDDALIKASVLSKKLNDQDLKGKVIRLALERGDHTLVKYIGVELKDLQSNKALVPLWNPSSLTEQDIDDNIEIISHILSKDNIKVEYNEETIDKLTKFTEKYPRFHTESPDFSSSNTHISELVSSQLVNPSSKYTKLRTSHLKYIGITQQNIQKTLELYNEYSTIDKNFDALMNTMVTILSHHSVITSNKQFLTIAETLVPQPITIQSIQSLILAHSKFDINQSLELYNQHIQKVSRSIENSEATLLTESLLWSYICQNDREFAYLINDGAIVNNIVQGDHNIARLKEVFKKYGEIVGDEQNDISKLLDLALLEAIKRV